MSPHQDQSKEKEARSRMIQIMYVAFTVSVAVFCLLPFILQFGERTGENTLPQMYVLLALSGVSFISSFYVQSFIQRTQRGERQTFDPLQVTIIELTLRETAAVMALGFGVVTGDFLPLYVAGAVVILSNVYAWPRGERRL